MKAPVILATLAVATLLQTTAMADALRCDTKVITEGAGEAEVADRCGEPAQVEHRKIYNGVATSLGTQPPAVAGTATEIQVDIWTYNFGPTRLMQRVRFENGVIVQIESLGYGY